MSAIIQALTGYLPLVLPEAVLGVVACVLFLGGTWRGGRNLWGGAALVGLGLAAVALVYTASSPDGRGGRGASRHRAQLSNTESPPTPTKRSWSEARRSVRSRADVYASPVSNTRLALFLKALAWRAPWCWC